MTTGQHLAVMLNVPGTLAAVRGLLVSTGDLAMDRRPILYLPRHRNTRRRLGRRSVAGERPELPVVTLDDTRYTVQVPYVIVPEDPIRQGRCRLRSETAGNAR